MCVSSAPRTRAYVKIADGCDCRCTYCAIPDARGPVRSRPAADVLAEIRRLADGGTREVVLTGIETASYGRERRDGYRLIDLLEEVDALGVPRIRLGSLTPEWLRPDTVARLARLTHLAPHFHLSVQSGSSAVLALMRRRYNARQAMGAIHALRDAIPDLMLTCDMIVGFPGESEENFTETLAFAEEARFLSMHVFAYSPREGTPAATFPSSVPEDVKAERSGRLMALAARMTDSILCEKLAEGRVLSVLAETERGGILYGHTPSFLPVAFRAPRSSLGRIRQVLPTEYRDGVLYGQMVTDNL
jgi:threonylcarbamoyladenosine tRNA methylthiotransferase MtaB